MGYRQLKDYVAFLIQQEVISVYGSEEDILSKVNNKINYEEQLRRVLQDTPTPEELSDDEFLLPSESPEAPPVQLTEAPPTTKTPALTATEYFATRSLLKSCPLPVTRKSSSSLCLTEEEPE